MTARIKWLRKKLHEHKLDALLATNPTNIRYLIGFSSADPTSREAYVVVTQKSAYILTSKLYPQWLVRKKKQPHGIEINRQNPLAKRLQETAQKERLKNIGFEENDLRVGELRTLEKKVNIRLVATQNLVKDLRIVKDADEIASIRKAAALTDQAYRHTLKSLTSLTSPTSLTEFQLAGEIEQYIRASGAELAFSPIVAFGKNAAHPHHVPSHRSTLNAHTLILLDFGARVNGYCSDMTRVVFFGKPTQKQKAVYEAVRAAQQAALNSLRSEPARTVLRGSGSRADEAARDVLKKRGLEPYPHTLGHGVGLEIHEGFRLSYKKSVQLKPGMVFTVEPGYYKHGWGGIRIEDLVTITKHGVEILTQSSKNLVVL